MLGIHVRKEAVISCIGIVGIVSIVGFYSYTYFKKNTKNKSGIENIVKSVFSQDMLISYEELSEKRKADPSTIILIDIRGNELFESEHIPQSTNIPFDIIDALTVKEGFTFIIITTVGNEQGIGAMAAQSIREKNSEAPVFILQGGFEGWKNASGQTISFGNPESIVDQSKVTYISAESFKKHLDAKQPYIVIDMRPKENYAQGHVPTAVNLPFDQLENLYTKIPAGTKIVSYGNSELEDFQTGVRLFDLGFFSVEVLKGGLAGWQSKGFDIQK